MRLSDQRSQAIASVLAFVVSAFVTAQVLEAAQAPDASQNTESTSSQEMDPRVAAQAPLVYAARQIQQHVGEKRLTNFAGAGLDNEKGAVLLYWKGPLPAEMADLVEELRANVQIDVVDRPYTLSELQQEALRIFALASAATGFNVTGAGPLPDFSGLGVAVESTEQLDRARQAIQSPIRLEFTVMPEPVLFVGRSRQGLVNLLTVVAAGLVATASVWFVTGKLRPRGSNAEGGSRADHLRAP